MDRENLINNFFENKLSALEQQKFTELLETDKTFADQVEFEQQIKAAITLNARESLKGKLQNFEQTYSKKAVRSPKWLFAAAGIAAIIGLLLLLQPNQFSESDLYSEYFKPYPNTVAPIVRSTGEINQKGKAFQAYESKDYVTSSVLFRQIYQDNHEEYAQFYTAISLMGLKDFEKSKDILATTKWSSDYSEKAQWYLALNYLAINQPKNSRIILQNIVRDKSYHAKNAKTLLKKLE